MSILISSYEMGVEGEESTAFDAHTTTASALELEHKDHTTLSLLSSSSANDQVDNINTLFDNATGRSSRKSTSSSEETEEEGSISSVHSLDVSSMSLSIDLQGIDGPKGALARITSRVKGFFSTHRRLKAAAMGGILLMLIISMGVWRVGWLAGSARDENPDPPQNSNQDTPMGIVQPLIEEPTVATTMFSRVDKLTRRKGFLISALVATIAIMAVAITLVVLHLTTDLSANELEPAQPIDSVHDPSENTPKAPLLPAGPMEIYKWALVDWPVILSVHLFVGFVLVFWLWVEAAGNLSWGSLLLQTIFILLLAPLGIPLCAIGVVLYALSCPFVQPAQHSNKRVVRVICKVFLAVLRPIGLLFWCAYAGLVKIYYVAIKEEGAKTRFGRYRKMIQYSWHEFLKVYGIEPTVASDAEKNIPKEGELNDQTADLDKNTLKEDETNGQPIDLLLPE